MPPTFAQYIMRPWGRANVWLRGSNRAAAFVGLAALFGAELCIVLADLYSRSLALPGKIALGLAAAGLALIALHYEESIAAYFRSRWGLRLVIVLIASVLVAFYLAGCSLHSCWSMIDDHEIIAYLTMSRDSCLFDIYMSTPDLAGSFPRFRPTYYLLRILESLAWGDHPERWFLVRILLLSATIAMAWLLLERWIGLVGGAFVCFFCLTYPMWAYLAGRLGICESYAAVGCGMFLVGMQKILSIEEGTASGGAARLLYWIMIAFGAILAMGSKENFLILLLPAIIIPFLLARQSRLDLLGLLIVTIIIIFGLFVSYVVLRKVGNIGTDQYGNSVALGDRMTIMLGGVKKLSGPAGSLVLAIATIAAVGRLQGARGWSSLLPFLRKMQGFLLLFLCLALVYLSQFTFYNGKIPTGDHYDFPGVLVLPVFAVALSVVIFHALHTLGLRPSAVRLVKGALVTTLAIAVFFVGYGSVRDDIKSHAQKTRVFGAQMKKLLHAVSENLNAPVLVWVDRAWAYEPVFALEQFVLAAGFHPRMYLRVETCMEEPSCNYNLRQRLCGELDNWSQHGGEADNWSQHGNNHLYRPLQELKDETHCIGVALGTRKEALQCSEVYRLDWDR